MQQNKGIRIILSGGGTGGHIFPAVAIANAIKSAQPDADILFVGAEGRMEMEKVPAAGYPIEGLWISGLQRKLTAGNLLFPFRVISSLIKARKIIRRFRPDVVIGTGGYASGPTLRMAAWMHIPTVIQEQNSFPGITNKMLAAKASRICVAYDGMEKYFPADRIRKTGNPVRSDIEYNVRTREEGCRFFGIETSKINLLVIGGSLGARTINESIEAGLDQLAGAGIQLIWQTGKPYEQQAEAAVQKYSRQGMLSRAFIREMDMAYAAADIVVSRAGAIAMSELCLTGKPVILVPSPNVAEDHQTKNAVALSSKGAAVLVRDADARKDLTETLLRLSANSAEREALSQKIKAMAIHDSAKAIATEVFSLNGNKL
jgi:UDP-N-acetylglucosamine--N-acetylmuramyl-(pentapeptide) pyrophosphoryl-undecaprenol N-acetylglucosamine transferase